MSGERESGSGGVVYAGIDEAGYGPLLGPLCVGLTVLRLSGLGDGSGPPDVWRLLRRLVRREPHARSTSWIAVNDSKRLKLPNSGTRLHPLTHLERGVLTFARQVPHLDGGSDEALFESLGARLGSRTWYSGEAVCLPQTTSGDHVRLLSTRLADAARVGGVEVLDMRCLTACEDEFNAAFHEHGTKSRVSFGLVGVLLRRVWESEASRQSEGASRVVIDRQGGRTSYAGEIEREIPGAEVEVVAESERASVYEVRERGEAGGRRMRVIFEVDADSRHFPVALASMTAKLVREMAMMRFNRYWGERLSEIKPTAGYRTDARRWLEDARRLGAPDEELAAMCRQA